MREADIIGGCTGIKRDRSGRRRERKDENPSNITRSALNTSTGSLVRRDVTI